jgi:hypothetical protein
MRKRLLLLLLLTINDEWRINRLCQRSRKILGYREKKVWWTVWRQFASFFLFFFARSLSVSLSYTIALTYNTSFTLIFFYFFDKEYNREKKCRICSSNIVVIEKKIYVQETVHIYDYFRGPSCETSYFLYVLIYYNIILFTIIKVNILFLSLHYSWLRITSYESIFTMKKEKFLF